MPKPKHRRRPAFARLGTGVCAVAVLGLFAPGSVPPEPRGSNAAFNAQVTAGSNTLRAASLSGPQNPGVDPLGNCYHLRWALPPGVDGSYVNRSNDGGTTWTRIATVPAPANTYDDCVPGVSATYNITTYLNEWESDGPGGNDSGGGLPPVVLDPPPLPWAVVATGLAETYSLTQTPDNAFYFTAHDSQLDSHLRRLGPDGKVTTIASGFGRMHGLTRGSDGNFYVAATDTLYRVTPAGAKTTIATGIGFAYGITQGTDGNLYVISSLGTLRRVTPAGAVSVVANGMGDTYAVTQGADGNFYVTSAEGNLIRVTPAGAKTTIASGLGTLFGVTVNKAGTFHVTTCEGNLYRLTPSGGSYQRTTVVSGYGCGYGITQGNDGNLYITEGSSGGRIIMVDI